jgi:hypothetical protein
MYHRNSPRTSWVSPLSRQVGVYQGKRTTRKILTLDQAPSAAKPSPWQDLGHTQK